MRSSRTRSNPKWGRGAGALAACEPWPEEDWCIGSSSTCLVMFERFGQKPEVLWEGIPPAHPFAEKKTYAALYNISTHLKGSVETESLRRGFRGVFFCDEPLDVLLHGIERILKGELWYSREVRPGAMSADTRGWRQFL